MQPLPPPRSTIQSLVRQRADGIKSMLRNDYPKICEEQKHLDKGSEERGYWNYGYLSALGDVIRLMSKSN